MTVGKHTYGTENMYIDCENHGVNLNIGSYCSIAIGISIMLFAEHRIDTVTTFPFNTLWGVGKPNSYSKGDINIGNDVWIGKDATIMSGVTIGDGAVISTKAVVTKDVPPYGIAVGNPARVKKYRFNKTKINKLLEIKWWDWTDEKVKENIDWLTNEYINSNSIV